MFNKTTTILQSFFLGLPLPELATFFILLSSICHCPVHPWWQDPLPSCPFSPLQKSALAFQLPSHYTQFYILQTQFFLNSAFPFLLSFTSHISIFGISQFLMCLLLEVMSSHHTSHHLTNKSGKSSSLT